MNFIVVVAALIIAVILCFSRAKRQRQDFEKRFPPISEAEFLARCSPGTNPVVALRVRRILADSLGVDYDRIYPSSRLIGDLGAE